MKKVLELFKFISTVEIWSSKRVKNILLSKSIYFYFLTLLFSGLSKILKPEKLLNYKISIQKNFAKLLQLYLVTLRYNLEKWF